MSFSKKRRGRKRRESKRRGRKRHGKKRNANPLQRRQRRDWRLCNRRLPAPKELVWRQCGLMRRVWRLRVLRRSVKPPYRKQPCGQTLNARTQLARRRRNKRQHGRNQLDRKSLDRNLRGKKPPGRP